ncbi:intradiol ring-cleavage dioxygenase [Aspergillus brunneoviolaceus CBS 621.78]|uniref:Aromatic compound dioxygenase n=1 Tax=Aspergillus brunneoviolaceus CBS 621.78 TaxID=1450534 RepID=A0ACD1GEJ6_9EURO|nr:aromatic compound dioxygenase [Aspergillus brunneoviolaceus CBS 621.78]RAH47714.1 aromatic compound dioxygenase [Aspergillus brunneoviolaceus CBS 621.78]
MKLQHHLIVGWAALAASHGGFEHETLEAAMARHRHTIKARRSLESCAGDLESSGSNLRLRARRDEIINHHRRRKRSTVEILNTTHLHTGPRIDPSRPGEVFADEHHVLLTPYGDNGPYYVPGELIREDAREDQLGVPIIVEAQFIDYESCLPVPGMFWDMWNANATGVYSGVINEGNGDLLDHSNVNATWLRAVQMADQDGVARIQTIFPGHYTGRTNHIHIIAHTNVVVLPNGTITGGSISHIGQFFFDQALIDAVETTYPYTLNPYAVIGNALDDTFHQETAFSASDPVFNYEYLGDTLQDGLYMWVRIGVNVSASWQSEYSFTHSANGGKYSCGTGRIGVNYTTSDEHCADNIDVGALPGETAPGPAVYSAAPPTAWDNATETAEQQADHDALQSAVAHAESTEAAYLASIASGSAATATAL